MERTTSERISKTSPQINEALEHGSRRHSRTDETSEHISSSRTIPLINQTPEYVDRSRLLERTWERNNRSSISDRISEQISRMDGIPTTTSINESAPPASKFSWAEAEKIWNEYSLVIIGATVFLILSIFFISRMTSSPTPLACANETVVIRLDKIARCRPQKPISNIVVTNELALKGCFLESLIKITPVESCSAKEAQNSGWFSETRRSSKRFSETYITNNNMNYDNPPPGFCKCDAETTVPSPNNNNPIPTQSSTAFSGSSKSSTSRTEASSVNLIDLGKDAAVINRIHMKLLYLRSLTGKWNDIFSEADLSDVSDRNILSNASFISIKFLSFGNDFNDDCSSDSKTSLITRSSGFKVHVIGVDPPLLTFSNFFRWKDTTAVSQHSEVVIVPVKPRCHTRETDHYFDIDGSISPQRCSHSTREYVQNANLTEKSLPANIVYSVLLCH